MEKNNIMFKKKIVTLFAIALFSSVFAASEIDAQGYSIFKVDSKNPLPTSTVNVNEGDIIFIQSIQGTFKPAKRFDPMEHQGKVNANKPAGDKFLYPKAGSASIVTVIGDQANYWHTTEGMVIKANKSGNLHFAINDWKTNYDDNVGEFSVYYFHFRKSDIKTFVLDTKNPKQDTGVYFSEGDAVFIVDITGTYKYNAGHAGFGQQGEKNQTPAGARFEYPDAGVHSLVGIFGDDNNYSQMNKSSFVDAPASGNLHFAINDEKNQHKDNIGKLTISYIVMKGAPGK